ncbi:MAG: hypothetical protein QOE70_6389 [Chthoniobacter sp.]|jgi:class 3 adenylate cyclase|nr:hypothetical protein [Chthoniobacter sp.]
MSREFHYRWQWRLRSRPEALWPLVADTNRFDRDAGLPPVERLYQQGATDHGDAHRVRTIVAGMTIEWNEQPFEWVRPERFAVLREYLKGPVKDLRVLVEFTPTSEGGTDLVYQVWTHARNWVGAVLIPIQVGIIARKQFARTFQRYDARAKTQTGPGTTPAIIVARDEVHLAPGGEARLASARHALIEHRMSPVLTDELVQRVGTADDMELTHLRPYAFADELAAPRLEALELFLRATRAGLLDLQWDLLCPLCRGAQQSSSNLGRIQAQVHCASCNIDFTANFERSVELTFRPNPAVREVVARDYCIGGPQITPHIVAQQVLPAGTDRELVVALDPGRYRVRAAAHPGGQSFTVAPGGAEMLEFRPEAHGWPDLEPQAGTRPTLRLVNATERNQRMMIERLEWSDQAVTAAEVTSLQVFRDLFSREALRPGEQISVGTLAVLFTDLRDSTRLYQQIGDAPAFGRVMNHFDILHEAVTSERGALVKTIGDSVMAIFRRPLSALKAILRAQSRLNDTTGPALTLKAGIHSGPCIAVTLNERLDYFGSTVNLAARVQRFSTGGDVVISDILRCDPEISAFLEASTAELLVEPFATAIPGFDDISFDLWRVTRVD